MSFYFDSTVHYNRRSCHNVVAHYFGNVLYFRKLHIKFVFADHSLNDLVG